MTNKQKSSPKKVLFNASVILAGHYSPKGGSAKLLSWVKMGKIDGIISEVILDEVERHAGKIANVFKTVVPAPNSAAVKKWQKIVADPGDAHLFATADEVKADFLVSLDKKHVLILRDKIKRPKIVSPKDLILLHPNQPEVVKRGSDVRFTGVL